MYPRKHCLAIAAVVALSAACGSNSSRTDHLPADDVPAGRVVEVVGTVYVARDAGRRELALDDEVTGADIITTTAESHVQIELYHNGVMWGLSGNEERRVKESLAWRTPKRTDAPLLAENTGPDRTVGAGRHAERLAAEDRATGLARPEPPDESDVEAEAKIERQPAPDGDEGRRDSGKSRHTGVTESDPGTHEKSATELLASQSTSADGPTAKHRDPGKAPADDAQTVAGAGKATTSAPGTARVGAVVTTLSGARPDGTNDGTDGATDGAKDNRRSNGALRVRSFSAVMPKSEAAGDGKNDNQPPAHQGQKNPPDAKSGESADDQPKAESAEEAETSFRVSVSPITVEPDTVTRSKVALIRSYLTRRLRKVRACRLEPLEVKVTMQLDKTGALQSVSPGRKTAALTACLDEVNKSWRLRLQLPEKTTVRATLSWAEARR